MVLDVDPEFSSWWSDAVKAKVMVIILALPLSELSSRCKTYIPITHHMASSKVGQVTSRGKGATCGTRGGGLSQAQSITYLEDNLKDNLALSHQLVQSVVYVTPNLAFQDLNEAHPPILLPKKLNLTIKICISSKPQAVRLMSYHLTKLLLMRK